MEKLDDKELKNIIETLLFITDNPVSVKKISDIVEIKDASLIKKTISELKQAYANSDRAFQIVEIAGGYQTSTKPEYGRWVRKLYKDKLIAKLSAASLETLAIVAYRQPITRAEIEQIRGVDVIAPLETLIEKGLIIVTGKKDTVGRPLLYGVTERFLRQFGLNTAKDLPELDSFEIEEEPKTEQQELFAKPKDVKIFDDDEKEGEEEILPAKDDGQTEENSSTQDDKQQEAVEEESSKEAEVSSGEQEVMRETAEEEVTQGTAEEEVTQEESLSSDENS